VLSALELQDFAIIDALRVTFAPGLNVLSGETGAGKSILVDALTLLIGGRAEARVVRSGAQSALVQGFFTDNEGADNENPDEFVAARRVQASGRSSARISGELVTVSELAERGAQRVAIHGQHASQTLLSGSEQRRLLDNLLDGAAQHTLATYGERYRRFTEVTRELAALQGALRERARQLDVLQFQVSEIAAAKLQADEEETIRGELESLRHAERIIHGGAGALARLSEGEPNVLALLSEAAQSLESAGRYHETPAALATELRSALESVQATSAEVESFLSDFGGDPERLEGLERRLSLIETLKLKYGGSVGEVLDFYARAEAEMLRLQNAESDLAQLQEEARALNRDLADLAEKLTKARQQAATRLSEAVTRELRPLGMENAQFSVELAATSDHTASGCDKVTFLLSANLGEPPAPLSAVASGGELSRVMLSLNVVTGSEQPTLVFDEVDAGLGGETARTVGALLKRLAGQRQVLVVTHLPQVAAFADAHFKVEKREQKGRTVTRVAPLTGAEREAELARMLSGAKTKTALAHARELLAEAQAGVPAK
jgi:DNA repair protein RecN (Recombination protein N)